MTTRPDTIYWYAPFDNAGELSLARAIAAKLVGDLVFESCSSRFNQALPSGANEPFTLVRDLPPPAGESGERRSRRRRLAVARERTRRRRQLITATQPSLVHLHTYNPATDWYDAPRLSRHDVPIVQSIHNVRPHDRQFPKTVETRLLGRGYRAFDRLIVAHDHLAARLVDEFEVDWQRIDIVPLPVESAAFRSGSGTADETVTTFLFFGTFRRNKGIEHYLRTIDALDDDASMRFVFAGRGDAHLEQQVLESAIRDHRVTAEIGYVSAERRAELYSSADVVVMPYTDLPAQSGVLRDAYASGRPVIASDVGALGATIGADGTGWVVDPGRPHSLEQTLRTAAATPAERHTKAARARQIAATRTPDHIAEQFIEVYEKALGASRIRVGNA